MTFRSRLCSFYFIIVFFIFGAEVLCTEPGIVDYESENAAWNPSKITVTLQVSKDAAPGSDSSLKIRGTVRGVVNFAYDTQAIPMSSRQFFRLSAWVKINRLGTDTPPPVIKCEFEAEDAGSYLGQGLSAAYDLTRAGTWQHLEGEFRVPFNTVRGRLAVGSESRLDNVTDKSREIDIFIADIRLERIPHYTIDDKYYLDPIPASLEKMRNVHPRLYLTNDRIAFLREAVKTTHKHLWEEIREQADSLLKRKVQHYMDTDEYSNIEQNYMRNNGNNMPLLAMAYVISGEDKYFDAAKVWALTSCEYPTWGLHEFANVDLATGHQLYGLALVYDWLYHDLDESARLTIRETLVRKASNLFDLAAKGIIVNDDEAYRKHPWPEWDEAYMQNHLWINSCGIGIAGLAVFDEVDGALRWPAFTIDRYARTMAILGDDGASHEGPGYWTYGVEWMLKFMELSRDLLEVDMYDNEWWRNTWKYRVYMGLPQHSWTRSNTTINAGDSPRYDWYGPDTMLRRLASEYGNGHAQWLADALDSADVEHASARWLNLLWYDPSVETLPPADLPTLHHFTDMDIASARSDWSGDESYLFFKCGPYVGHKAIRELKYCPSSAHHVHPDTGNFMVFANGEWLIIDDGYRGKYTGQHNTLIIDGGEQLGGGYPIFHGDEAHGAQARPRIIRADSSPEFDHLTGDATEAYPSDSGLIRYRRHLLYLKPDILIVCDDIVLDNEKELELRFHPEQQKAGQEGSVYTTRGEKAALRIDPLSIEGVEINDENLITLPKEDDGKKMPMYTIRLRTLKKEWRNAVALSWSEAGGNPVDVVYNENGNVWTFSAGKRTVTLDWATGDAEYSTK